MTSSFTLLEAVAVQAIKGVHGGTKAQTSAKPPKLGLKSLLLYKKKDFTITYTSYNHNFSDSDMQFVII